MRGVARSPQHRRVLAAVLAHRLSLGTVQLLSPKTGLHNAALSAGVCATFDSCRAARVLGYRPLVTREEAQQHCAAWVAAGGRRIEPLIRVEVVP